MSLVRFDARRHASLAASGARLRFNSPASVTRGMAAQKTSGFWLTQAQAGRAVAAWLFSHLPFAVGVSPAAAEHNYTLWRACRRAEEEAARHTTWRYLWRSATAAGHTWWQSQLPASPLALHVTGKASLGRTGRREREEEKRREGEGRREAKKRTYCATNGTYIRPSLRRL